MRIWVIAAALLTGLSACNMTGPRHPGEMFMSDSEIQAKDDRLCRSYGVSPGSNAYVACRMQAQQQRYEASPDTRMSRMGPVAFPVASAPARVEMNCTTSRMGNFVTTNCD